DEFLATLPLAPTDQVLDVGCGSGDFTAIVAARVPDGHVTGLEPQPSMLREARARARTNQSFVEGAAQQLDVCFPAGAAFDVVFSRSVLHWVPAADHPAILASCRRLLRDGGWLRIECGGGDNVREVVAFLGDVAAEVLGPDAPRNPWNFLGAGEYLDRV